MKRSTSIIIIGILILSASILYPQDLIQQKTFSPNFTEEDIIQSVDFIKRRIKEEVYNSSFGLQEGFKIGVQGDVQVLKALEVLPEAKLLMTSGRTEPAIKNQTN